VRNELGCELLSDAVLGQFSFQRLATYDDNGRHATEIAEHEHCRRIAGDDSTRPSLAVAIPSPGRFDTEVHPSKLPTILPCDSSQLEAILAIKSGASLVLDGPGEWPSLEHFRSRGVPSVVWGLEDARPTRPKTAACFAQ
jgi:hypothetical protein